MNFENKSMVEQVCLWLYLLKQKRLKQRKKSSQKTRFWDIAMQSNQARNHYSSYREKFAKNGVSKHLAHKGTQRNLRGLSASQIRIRALKCIQWRAWALAGGEIGALLACYENSL